MEPDFVLNNHSILSVFYCSELEPFSGTLYNILTIQIFKMPDNKQSCKKCKGRHAPPTGKKCQRASTSESQEHLSDAAVSSGSKEKDAPDGQLLQHAILDQLE